MSKKQKRNLIQFIIIGALVFLALVLSIPMMTVEPVALGAEPTLWQNIHKFFSDVKTWFTENLMLVGVMALLAFIGVKFLKK